MTPLTPAPGSPRTKHSDPGWRIVQAAALLALLAAALSVPSTFFQSDPQVRVPLTLLVTGFAAFRALVAYGVWLRARWAAWLGGLFAVFMLLLAPFVVLAQSAAVGGLQVQRAEWTPVLALLQVLASAAFLFGLYRIRRSRGSDPV